MLIVEDHDDMREMLRVLLERKSCQVLEACNDQEAVEIARREHPDLILMDGSLPEMDGLEAASRIREDVQLREVLILYKTNRARSHQPKSKEPRTARRRTTHNALRRSTSLCSAVNTQKHFTPGPNTARYALLTLGIHRQA